MNEASDFLEKLEIAQRDLGCAVSSVEARLSASRMERLAPVPVGDTGRYGPPSPVSTEQPRRIAMPETPALPPVEILVGGGRRETSPAAPTRTRDVDAAGGEPRSLVHQKIVVGNRRRIEPIASVRVRVESNRLPGLMPGFDPAGAIAYFVEVSVHLVGRVDEGDDLGLEIGPLVPSMVAEGWPFRAHAWTASVRRELAAVLDLPGSLTAIAANGRDPDPDGRLHGGDRFVIVALDPSSDERGGRLKEPGAAVAAVSPPAPDRGEPGKPESARTEEVADAAPRDAPIAAGTGLLQRMRRIWESGLVDTVGGSSRDAFHRALDEFERDAPLPQGVTVERLLESFADWCRDHAGAVRTGAIRRAPPEGEAAGTDSSAPTSAGRAVEVPAGWALRAARVTLERKFKHAPDFGVHERFGPDAVERFREEIERHVAGAFDRHRCRYLGRTLIAHVGNGRIVWTTAEGAFVTGYRAFPAQLRHAWSQPGWSPS